MKLHGQDVQVQDYVHDLLEGKGRVIVATDSEIIVRFSNSRTYSYNSAGSRVGNVPSRLPPLLYWHNPIVVNPPKKMSNWDALKELFLKAHEIFNRF